MLPSAANGAVLCAKKKRAAAFWSFSFAKASADISLVALIMFANYG